MNNGPFPNQIAYLVSRNAVLLYAFLLSHANSDGVIESTRRAAMDAALSREEGDLALAELIEANFVECWDMDVPIAELGSGIVWGSQRSARLTQYSRPLLSERLSPADWASLRASIFQRDDFTCQYCGKRGGSLECDHIQPISSGGTNEPANLVTSCSACNRGKNAKRLEDWKRHARA